MSRLILPGRTFEARVQGFPSGLVGTVGVRLLDNVGGTTTARTTTGITEDPASSGSYVKVLTAPSTAGEYTVFWDTGTVGPSTTATELILVTESSVAAPGTDPDRYITRAQLKTTLELTGETYADADADMALEAASRAIDGHCGRRFYADADALQVRYYSPWAKDLLRIDDLVTLTSLKSDPGGDGVYEETWVENTDFIFEPQNRELIGGSDREPYTLVRVLPRGNFLLQPKYPRTVQLTGKFGWPAVPPAVEEACTVLAGRLLKRARETPYGVAGLGIDGGAVRIVRVDPDVQMLLAPLVRGRGLG